VLSEERQAAEEVCVLWDGKKRGNESSHGVKVGRRLYVWALGLPLITQNGILYAPFPGGRGGGCLQNRRPADDR